MSKPLLEIINVSKVYTDKKTTTKALDGVSLHVQEGEILGLLGVNGAGKTTLSSLIATLHPPTSGDIRFDGVSIYSNLMNYRRALGFCPQRQNLDTFLTVQENLIFAGRYFLMSEADIKERVAHLMAELELTRYADFSIHALSGGTKQRVLIARALIHNPRIIVLDEPTVGLDPGIRKKLWRQIHRLKDNGITVILTTHYLDEAEELADRVCILHKGKVQLTESVATLKQQHNQAKLEDIFLHLMDEYRTTHDDY